MAEGDNMNAEFKGAIRVLDPQGPVNIGGQMNVTYHDTSHTFQEKQILLSNRRRQILEGLKSSLRTFHGDEKSSFFPLPWTEEEDKLNLEDNFVDLRIYETNREAVDDAAKAIQLDELFVQNGVGEKEVAKGDRLLLVADAGFGKTTLCRKIAHDWARNKPYVSRFTLVFVILLQNLKGTEVDQWILESFKDKCDLSDVSDDELMDVVTSIASDVLWIMDGYDEVPLSCRDTFEKVIRKKHSIFLNEATILVASRPLNKFLESDCFRRKFLIRGFYKEEQELFIDNFFRNDETTAKEDLKNLLWSNIPEMKEISQSPLLLYLLCSYHNFMEEEGRVKVKTKSDIYDIIVNSLIKLCSKKNEYIQELIANYENKDELYKLLLPLGKFCTTLLHKNTIVFMYDYALKVLGENINLLSVGIFRQEMCVRFGKKKVRFRPYHHSFVEYLASLYCEHAVHTGFRVPNCIFYDGYFQQELAIVTTENVINIKSVNIHRAVSRFKGSKGDTLMQWLGERLSKPHVLVFVKHYNTSEKVLNWYRNNLYNKINNSSSLNERNFCRMKWPTNDVTWEDVHEYDYEELHHQGPQMLETAIINETSHTPFLESFMNYIKQDQLVEMCICHDKLFIRGIIMDIFLAILKPESRLEPTPPTLNITNQINFNYFGSMLLANFETLAPNIEGIEMYIQSWTGSWIYPHLKTRQAFTAFLENPYPIFNVILDLLLSPFVLGMTTSYGQIKKVQHENTDEGSLTFYLTENLPCLVPSFPSLYSLPNHRISLNYFYSQPFREPKNQFLLILFLLLQKRDQTVEILSPDMTCNVQQTELRHLAYFSLKRMKKDVKFMIHMEANESVIPSDGYCYV